MEIFRGVVCETLDEIHEAQLAAVIAKMRKQREKLQLENSLVDYIIF